MAQSSASFKSIEPVPSGSDFLDIVLSRTQRRLPTVIRPGFKISRIRSFYARKVKYTQESFTEKLDGILTQFPRLDTVHPFHADLFNVLYDREHYKIALGQLSTAKHLIENVSRDYLRLLKFGDSLYRCKQLKRAALGRMATIIKKQKDPLAYLEQVRQHLARLPAIEVNTRTLILAGYPNVGKSSFMNKVTRADVDVQPYAFTTKSLFVGHMDYKYLRWQVIDTPGILDHPLEEMNTIEMQSVTALAHLRSCVLYFMDLSGECGYSVDQQVQLFQNIRPLFANKVTFLAINKIDRVKPSDLDPDTQALLQGLLADGTVELLELSCATEEGVMQARNRACEKLLAARVEQKLKGGRINDVLNKIHLATPMARDDVPRLPFIPDAVKNRGLYDWNDPDRRKLEKDLEVEAGGAGAYSVDLKKNYVLDNPDWKYDVLPEIKDGKNVYDFIDPEIEEKLNALEAEEERLEAGGFYDSDEDIMDDEETEILEKADKIRTKIALRKNESRLNKKSLKNRAIMPRTKTRKRMSQLENHLKEIGLDSSAISARARGFDYQGGDAALTGEDVVMRDAGEVVPSEQAIWRVKQRNRAAGGLKSQAVLDKVEQVKRSKQRGRNLGGRQGEADRRVTASKPKHMLVGKRKMGKTNRR